MDLLIMKEIISVKTPFDSACVGEAFIDAYAQDKLDAINRNAKGGYKDGKWFGTFNSIEIDLSKIYYISKILYYENENKFEVYDNENELRKIFQSNEFAIKIK